MAEPPVPVPEAAGYAVAARVKVKLSPEPGQLREGPVARASAAPRVWAPLTQGRRLPSGVATGPPEMSLGNVLLFFLALGSRGWFSGPSIALEFELRATWDGFPGRLPLVPRLALQLRQ